MPKTREDHLLPESWIEIVAAVGFDESHECWEELHHAVERAARAATVAHLERIAIELRSDLHRLPEYTHGSLAWRLMNDLDRHADDLKQED